MAPGADNSAQPDPSGGRSRKGRFAVIGLVSGIMLVEGVGIFVATRFLGGGADSAVASVPGLEAPPAETQAPRVKELLIAEFRAMNDRSGQNILYDVKVYGRVEGARAAKVEAALQMQKATVADRLAKVVRAADPQYFKEPGLETLRRQIKNELSHVLSDEEMVDEVLIPSLMWYQADG
jgi:flagellar basal body-associated protein FliL